jgi:MFS family permease
VLVVRSPRNPDAFPATQLFVLAIVRLAEPIALTSIFPYAWSLVKRFQVGSEEDATFYAGLLISAFSLTEAAMGMFWGGLSDRIGRKPVLLLGCIGTMFSLVMVGFAQNIWVALVARALGGMLNGNIGVIQTMVAELCTHKSHEPRAYSVMPFVWSIGTIVGPSIGGLFADPHKSYPALFPRDSLFAKYPYLLPNLMCAALLLLSIVLGFFLLEETHPDMIPHVMLPSDTYISDETPLFETSDAIKQPAVDLRSETYGTIRRSVEIRPNTPAHGNTKKDAHQSIFTKRIMALVVALSIFTYHSMTYDHLLPIYFEDARAVARPSTAAAVSFSFNPFYSAGGLGLSIQSVGMILAVDGAIALLVQAVIFPIAAAQIGVSNLFILTTILQPITYLLMPMLVHVPQNLLFPVIYACLTVRNILSIIQYPVLLILIKEATPCSTILGKVNGFAASAGAACRMVAPPIAGYLYAVGSRADCTVLAWYGSVFVAVIGAVQCFWVERVRNDGLSEEAGEAPKQPTTVRVCELVSDEEGSD